MKRILIIIRKLILKFFERFTGPYFFTETLRMEGFQIGSHTIFYEPKSICIDRERPWMLRIGSCCRITSGVTILCHDYSRSVLRSYYGEFIGEARETIIGDNVFIGMNSIVLMGTHIGNNVIIGAGSVVSGYIPDNVVVAGNPAKIIRTLDEHYISRKNKTLSEACLFVSSYKRAYGFYPGPKMCGPFFTLFENRDTFDYDNDARLHCNGDDHIKIVNDFKRSKPMFSSYDEFISYVEAQPKNS